MLTVETHPGFLNLSPTGGAGRVHHSVIEALGGRTRRPRPWRRPDVWLSDVVAAPECGQPVVSICHGAEWLRVPDLAEHPPSWWFEPFAAKTEAGVRSSAVTIVPSEFTRGAVIEGWGIAPERVSAVHHGVDIDRFKPQQGGAGIVTRELGAPRPYVLFVGIPSRAKGTLVLKRAFRRLIDGGFPHALVVVGPPSDLEIPGFNDEVDAPMSEPDRFLRIESLNDDELAPLMAGADAFCLPSIKESFGLPTLEAMASGVPVVVANRAALPEVVGDAGVLCEPTEEDVAEALARVLADKELARELGDAGRRRAMTMTWDHTANGWLTALERAAREH